MLSQTKLGLDSARRAVLIRAMKKIISTAEAPAAVGPYSQAIRAGNFVFCSGQIPLDPKTGKITEYHTKTPISGPHGLTMDRDGNIYVSFPLTQGVKKIAKK